MDAILEFIITNPKISASIGIAVLTLIFFVLSIVFGRSFSLKLGPLAFGVKNKKDTSTEETEEFPIQEKPVIQENHANQVLNCQHQEVCKQILGFLDIYDSDSRNRTLVESIVNEVSKRKEMKDKLVFIEAIAHRMLRAEEYIFKIKASFTEKYAELLKTKIDQNEDPRLHKDYKMYQIIVSNILDEIKRNTIKQSIDTTDIISLTSQEFETFKEQKSELMTQIISEYLDVIYNCTSVRREEILVINIGLKDKIKSLIKEMYSTLKDIISQDKLLVEKIEEDTINKVAELKDQFISEDPLIRIKKILDDCIKN